MMKWHQLQLCDHGLWCIRRPDQMHSCKWCFVVGVDATSFTYLCVRATEGFVLIWIILTKETVSPIKGFNVATGAEQGFIAPTNKDNSVGATQYQFCTALKDRIPWPLFGPKIPEPVPTMPNGPPPPPLPAKEKWCTLQLAMSGIHTQMTTLICNCCQATFWLLEREQTIAHLPR